MTATSVSRAVRILPTVRAPEGSLDRNRLISLRSSTIPGLSSSAIGRGIPFRINRNSQRALADRASTFRARISAASVQRAGGGGRDYDALAGVEVFDARTGSPVELLSLWEATPGTKCIAVFLTHFADLSSWEYAQKLRALIPKWEARGFKVVAVGLGGIRNAEQFAEVLNFPISNLYADPMGACYSALGFSPGFGPDIDVNPYLKLLPMLMGIGSPGTIQEVLRGYVGDRKSGPVFEGSTPFNILGKGYQRPFELATLRLQNMIGILPRWQELSPEETRLLTQQGGTLVFDGRDTIFRHSDSGILKYCDVAGLEAALDKSPGSMAS